MGSDNFLSPSLLLPSFCPYLSGLLLIHWFILSFLPLFLSSTTNSILVGTLWPFLAFAYLLFSCFLSIYHLSVTLILCRLFCYNLIIVCLRKTYEIKNGIIKLIGATVQRVAVMNCNFRFLTIYSNNKGRALTVHIDNRNTTQSIQHQITLPLLSLTSLT